MSALSRIRDVLLVGVPSALLLACSDSTSPNPVAEAVASVIVAAPASALQVGETLELTATPRNAAGEPLADRRVEWSSSDASVITVTSSGVATARRAGSARVRASSEGKSAGVDLVVMDPPQPEPEPEPLPAPVHTIVFDVGALAMPEGESRIVVATLLDANGEPTRAPVTWNTSNSAVVEVFGGGQVRARSIGVAMVTASAGDKEAELQVTVMGTSPYELLFDRWMNTGAGLLLPEVHRLDFNIPGMPALRLIGPSAAPPSAAVSPDGNSIAYVCGQHSSICISDRSGDFVAMLTAWGENADQPAWSPDGSRIAFRRWSAGGPPGVFNNADIWVMNTDGSGKVNLTAGSLAGTSRAHPTWSPKQPDGSYHIAYAEERLSNGYRVSQIRSMRDDGSDQVDITANAEYLDDEPAWSPDGNTIAFVRTGGASYSELHLVNATGGNERPFLTVALHDEQRGPAWSPDGTMLAFSSNHEIIGTYYTYQIYTAKANGTDVVRRTSDNTEKQNPVWRVRVQ